MEVSAVHAQQGGVPWVVTPSVSEPEGVAALLSPGVQATLLEATNNLSTLQNIIYSY